MIPGLISQELHEQLLDLKNFQSRTNGVEELKRILSEVDLKSVPPESIEKFINFLPRLLDDNNFKVLFGGLQVLNLLIQKLDAGVDKYFKRVVLVALKSLGDTRTLTRNEYLNAFQQLMKVVEPQQVLSLVIGNLKHKNSRVREDVLNIIMAAMLTHPRNDFNISKLCFEIAPYLADSKRRVRLAALELFAVFDHCLDVGKKQILVQAVDRVELNEDAGGLMAAVQARRARRVLPKLTESGVLEYGLVVPKPGQWCSEQHGSGADLDWVIHGGRISSAKSYRPEPESDRLYGYGSLGSLTDDLPLQRRIVSAGKGKNKLPWELPDNPSTENEQQRSISPEGKFFEKMTIEDFPPLSKKQETYIPSFSACEPQKLQTSRRREVAAHIRRSGSLNLDADIFKTINFSEQAAPKGRMLSRNPSVERTFSLPSNPSTPGSFLLPSYPLAAHPVGVHTPSPSCHPADSALSMSNTWPNKRENSPHQKESGNWRETTGKIKGEGSNRCSPRLLRSSLVSSTSASSFRQAMSNPRATFFLSPVAHRADHALHLSDQRAYNSSNSMNQHTEKSHHVSDSLSLWHNQDGEDLEDTQEMRNSLRTLHNSAAIKRAVGGHSSSDPNSPDSAVREDVGLGSPFHSTKTLKSSASESGLSSLSFLVDSSFNGMKTSDKSSSMTKPRPARVPTAKLRSSVSMELSSLQVSSQTNELPHEVGVVGQRVTLPNGTINAEEESNNPGRPQVKPSSSESVRSLKGSKGSQSHNGWRASPSSDIPEGVIGKGMFDPVSTHCLDVIFPLEQGSLAAKPPIDPLATIHSNQINSSDGLRCDETNEIVRHTRLGRNKTRTQRVDHSDLRLAQDNQVDEGIQYRVQQMFSDSLGNENVGLIIEDLHLNGSTLTKTKADISSEGSPKSPISPSSPPVLHQPSPPTVPPSSRNTSHLRRVSSLNRARPSLSHSSDGLSQSAAVPKKNLSEPAVLGPFSKPDLALTQSFDLLSSEDWEKKIEGLMFLRSLALYHPETLHARLHDVCLTVIQEVKNLRSGVSRVAVCTVGDLYTYLQRAMDQELEGTVKALLQKAGESNTFIKQDVDAALNCMVQHCNPTRGISALLSGGVSHLSPIVRKYTSQHLSNLVKKVGAARLLSGGKDLTERVVVAVTKLAQDSSQDARFFGRRMLLFLSSHPDFEKTLEKYIPSKDLQTVKDTLFTLRKKGNAEMLQDAQSARGRRSLPGSGTARASSLNRELLNQTTREQNSHPSCRAQPRSLTDKNEYIKQISGLLGSKDFRERIRGIDQLVADCQHNPNMVINSLLPIFDAFKARLQESNSKVNLYALESLQKMIHLLNDNLSPVINILVPAIVDNHLNSKNNAVYCAATGAINALVSNLDNMLLLQPFCTKAQFSSGKAKVDIVEKVAEFVTELYPRKPQTVEQKVLPLLWHLLGSIRGRGGSLRAATVNLCQALYAQMGSSLSECAASQTESVHRDLNEILRAPSQANTIKC